MKVRDSGMPPETIWSTFFDVDTILNTMQVNQFVNNILEVGCGYGTFTIDAEKKIKGKLLAYDIEQKITFLPSDFLQNFNLSLKLKK